jgi:glycosyltransferase involved in cell wall biosynthesis
VLFIYGIEAWQPRYRAKPFLDSCGAVVSISDITLRRFRDWSSFNCQSYLLPNAIHLDEYSVVPKDGGRRVLMTLGRLAGKERYKGFDEVLDNLRALPNDVIYVIAGEGEDAPRLRRKAKDLGVSDRVVFTGFVREEEKAALYASADVYVMPSRGEGFGFVLLEAMACGIPTIASKHDGGREALRDGLLGMLVDPTSPAEIRAAIWDALEFGKRARPDGLEYFAFDRFVERTRAIIDDVMRGKQ